MSETLRFISTSKIEFSSREKRSSRQEGNYHEFQAKIISFIERIYDDVLDARLKRDYFSK